MSTPIHFEGSTFTYDELKTYGPTDLCALYNRAAKAAGAAGTKRFGDKQAALRRTWEMLAKVSQASEQSVALVENALSEVEKRAAEKQAGEVKIENFDNAKLMAKLAEKGVAEGEVAKLHGKKVVKVKTEQPKAEPKQAKVKAERKEREKWFHRAALPVKDQKPVQKGKMRAKLYQLLSREHGATFEQLLAATWGDPEMRATHNCSAKCEDPKVQNKTCYEATRLLATFNGFGLYHDNKDHVHVYSTSAELEELSKKYPPKHPPKYPANRGS
jgi:uncharacterized cupredoxin-like copper-binding protein